MRIHPGLIVLALLLSASNSQAQWISGGRLIPFESTEFVPRIVSDGAHGTFVLTDRLTHLDAAGRIIGGGFTGYQPGASRYFLAGVEYLRDVDIAPDGHGGLYLSRTRYQNGEDHEQGSIRVDHFGPNLALDPSWPANGYEIAPITWGDQTARLIPDPSGDVYVSWSVGGGIGVQRLTRSGQPAIGWPAGRGVVIEHPRQEIIPGVPFKTPTGVFRPFKAYTRVPTFEGALLPDSLIDLMGGVSTAASAPPAWPEAVLETGADLRAWSITHDGGAGFYATNERPYHLLQDLSIDPAWPAPEVLSLVTQIPIPTQFLLPTPDGAGGCFMAYRADAFYITRVGADGHPSPGWTAQGRAATKAANALIPDGEGGAFLFGVGTLTNPPRTGIFMQHATPQGERAAGWPLLGKVLATASTMPFFTAIPDGMGGAVLFWKNVSGSVTTMRALGVNALGDATAGVGDHPFVAALSASPSPSQGPTRLRFALAHEANVSLEVLDLAGRRVRDFSPGRLGSGAHAFVWDGRDESGHSVAPGVYLARAVLDGEVSTTRIVRLR